MLSRPCVVCQSTDYSFLFKTRDRHYGIPGEFDLVRCTDCGVVRLDPIPTEEELASFYAKDYYAYKRPEKNGRLRTFAGRLIKSRIITHNPPLLERGEFLDIGCGSGDYLHYMHAQGWKVHGVEPSTFGAEEGRKAGLDIFNGTLCQAGFASGSFDYVRSNHSFEHMPDPIDVLNEIYRILKPNGKFYIGVPNIDSIAYRVFGKFWWHLCAPVHTYNYGLTNISALLHQSGFVVEKVYFNANFTSLLGSLQIFANRKNGKKSADGWLIRNPILKLLSSVLVRMVDLVGEGDTIEIIARKVSKN
jgi:SAM-dependent methyltransferase